MTAKRKQAAKAKKPSVNTVQQMAQRMVAAAFEDNQELLDSNKKKSDIQREEHVRVTDHASIEAQNSLNKTKHNGKKKSSRRRK